MKRKLKWLIESTRTGVIFEDDHLLVLNKPAGLLVLPDRYKKELPNLYAILNGELGKIFVVHRIDKETSGIIVFGKTAEAHAALNAQFEGRRVEKIYSAIVVGDVNRKEGSIELPLAQSSTDAAVVKVDNKKGKDAVTLYRVAEQFHGYALLEVRPKTERMHQIRVHLGAIGLPILADTLYGGGEGFYLSQVKGRYKAEGEEKPLLSRTALHASGISFVHPVNQETMTFSSPLPKDMSSVLKYLRKFRSIEQTSF